MGCIGCGVSPQIVWPYGMTESSPTITTLDPKDVMRKMASVGKPFVNVEIRLVDEEGNDVPMGEVGEIEEVLYAHPKILEAAVIGLPDPDWGEKVHAVIAPKEGENLTGQEVIDYCKSRIASFKKPKNVEFVDKLPRSAAGKVLKRILRKQR